MSRIAVRRGTKADFDAITGLWRELAALLQEVEPVVYTATTDAPDHFRRHLSRSMDQPDHVVFVALTGERVIGYLVAFVQERPPVREPHAVGGIGDCCVTRTFRRRGIGSLLVREAMKWFRSQGLKFTEVGYAVKNPEAVSFWSAQGFQPYSVMALRAVELEDE